MEIGSYDQMIGPLLQYLAERTAPVRASEAMEGVAKLVGLDDNDKRKLLPSGNQLVYKNRIGWAQDALKRNGLSRAPKFGYWEITNQGKLLLDKHAGSLSPDVSRELASQNRSTPLADLLGKTDDSKSASQFTKQAVLQSPEEKIDAGLNEIILSVATELLDLVHSGTPEFFEHLVLDLLHAMGYGIDRKSLQQVGGSGDGGIDGIISLDRLGLEKVYVQAKRWKGQVGSPQVQGFVGALQLNGATKGVLISAGPISKPAFDSAARANVVLIDGNQLARLMIEHSIGISERSIRIPKIDSDYFET